jgi:hypothetical protein
MPISAAYIERVTSTLWREWQFFLTVDPVIVRSPAMSSNGVVDSAMVAASSAAANTTSENELRALLATSRGKC